jgi:hypothetical protein
MASRRRLIAATATLATLAAFVAVAGPPATAQTTDAAVLALEEEGVLAGTNCSTTDCEGDLLRWEAALWLTNALDLSTEGSVSFGDVPTDSEFALTVSSLFAAGVTVGCTSEPLQFCPDEFTTRAQMATFLARAFDLDPQADVIFANVNVDGIHGADITAVWQAGIVEACRADPLSYCPWEPITRRQAALMLYRALQRPGSDTDSSEGDETVSTGDHGVGSEADQEADRTPDGLSGPTSTSPTNPRPIVPPVQSGCAVVDRFNTTHDIDDHGGDATTTSHALLADGTLFGHRHLRDGGALCWMWAPPGPDGEGSDPISVQPPSHTH